MLADGELERVQASREHAGRLLNQARRHLDSAQATCESDPEGAHGTLYDAGRKALWAILANQGLRPTTKGGHLAVYHAVKRQLDPPMGQQLRHSTGCGDSGTTPSIRRSTPPNSTPTTSKPCFVTAYEDVHPEGCTCAANSQQKVAADDPPRVPLRRKVTETPEPRGPRTANAEATATTGGA